ncbi:UNVERIFIED_CONTAM: hypothetical protein FKN15_004164 [Acipenser sinensis]
MSGILQHSSHSCRCLLFHEILIFTSLQLRPISEAMTDGSKKPDHLDCVNREKKHKASRTRRELDKERDAL